MKIKNVNYYNFDHKRIIKTLVGDLKFIGYTVLEDEYYPVAVYQDRNPNKSKGHKEFVTAQVDLHYQGLVRGFSRHSMLKQLKVDAIKCLQCDTVIYSIFRHHSVTCECSNEAMVDGGKDYFKYGAQDISKVVVCKLNLLTKTIRYKRQA